MDIKFISEKKTGETVFLLQDSTPAFANALRRLMIEEVPVMAIEEVEIRRNSSVLYDEMVALRLGLLPLTTDLKSYNLPSECKCNGEGCARCQVKFSLKAKGPAMIYAGDLTGKDPKIKPVYAEMPIVKLLKGQKIELEATAQLGLGKEHMKWSPGHVWYNYKPYINSKNFDSAKEVRLCPSHDKEAKTKKSVEENMVQCPNCLTALESQDLIQAGDETEFVFYIEPWGQLSAVQIFNAALDSFESKVASFKAELKKENAGVAEPGQMR